MNPPETTSNLLRAAAERLGALGPRQPAFLDEVALAWRPGPSRPSLQPRAQGRRLRGSAVSEPEWRAWLDPLGDALSRACAAAAGSASLGRSLRDSSVVPLVITWAEVSASRPDVVLSPLLAALGRSADAERSRVERAARARVSSGPFLDALDALASTGDGRWLDDPAHGPVRARVELLLWEAGAGTVSTPSLGRWLLERAHAFDALVLDGARRTLRHRVVAARALLVAADGLAAAITTPSHEPETSEWLTRTLRLLERLAGHPEPVVWIPAARALGRLAPAHSLVRLTLARWLDSDGTGDQRRAVTALASMPAHAPTELEHRLEALIAAEDPWAVAAFGPAVPHLAVERRAVWTRLVRSLGAGGARPEILWSLAHGLVALGRREPLAPVDEELLRATRRYVLELRASSATDAQLLREVRRATDSLDRVPPDPSDVHGALDRLVEPAIAAGAETVWTHAETIARSLRERWRDALDRHERAAGRPDAGLALADLDSTSLAAALALWRPLLTAAARDPAAVDRDGELARDEMLASAQRLLAESVPRFPIHRAALRALGRICDAEDRPSTADPSHRRGRRGVEALRAIEQASWLRDPTREDRTRFRKAVGDVLWRVADSTRHAPAAPRDAGFAGRIAAWWAVASDHGASILGWLGRSEAEARGADVALQRVTTLRRWLDASGWQQTGTDLARRELIQAFDELGAGDTALAIAVSLLPDVLAAVARAVARPSTAGLVAAVRALAQLVPLLREVVADPVSALSAPLPVSPAADDALVDRSLAVQTEADTDPEALATLWAAGLGPTLGPLVTSAACELLRAHHGRHLVPRPSLEQLGDYTVVRELGSGAMGRVVVVRDALGLHFVAKMPTLDGVPPDLRPTLVEALRYEIEVLRTVPSRKITRIVDFDLEATPPFVVTEYVRGVDLGAYTRAGRLSIDECKPVVAAIAHGLASMHRHGIVHCDLKPGNVLLCLGGLAEDFERFDPTLHRDTGRYPVEDAVLIDFGISRPLAALRSADDPVQGTPGFLSPEQVHAANRRIDGRADVYALAATVYYALTARTFFDDRTELLAYLTAHLSVAPMTDPETLQRGPADLLALLHDATRLDPAARPTLDVFSARFAALPSAPAPVLG